MSIQLFKFYKVQNKFFKQILLKNFTLHLYQQFFNDYQKQFDLRRNNYSITVLKMVIMKLRLASQDWEFLSNAKPQSLDFHSNFNYRTNLPKVDKPVLAEQKVEHWGGQEAFNTIIFITENYNEVIQANSSILVFFSAEWCSHCKELKQVYGKAALKAFKASLPIKFAFFDVNIKLEIAEEHGVVGIPIIKYYKDGKFISNYKGKRTIDDLYKFAQNPPTKFVESIEANY